MDSLITIRVLVLLSAISGWLKKCSQARETDAWPPPPRDQCDRPRLGRGRPPLPPPDRSQLHLGRLLPQAVYPFFAYSRIAQYGEPLIASVPSGNFGDMMGTVIAKEMGLPVQKILCGVNENREFPHFLETGEYVVKPSVHSPSSAMIVSNPSNFARLLDLYSGHVYDRRDAQGRVIQEGVIDIHLT